MRKALIVVDVQNDFIPGGSLAVKDGDKIIPIINELLPQFDIIVFTKDWHPVGNIYFASSHLGMKPFEKMELNGKLDTLWPDHCVQNTIGADIHKDINFDLIKGDFYIIKKGDRIDCHPYGAFGDKMGETELESLLKENNVTHNVIVGLALDFCIKDTAIDSAKKGFKTVVIEDATRPINDDINETLKKFKDNNVNLIKFFEYEQWENDQNLG